MNGSAVEGSFVTALEELSAVLEVASPDSVVEGSLVTVAALVELAAVLEGGSPDSVVTDSVVVVAASVELVVVVSPDSIVTSSVVTAGASVWWAVILEVVSPDSDVTSSVVAVAASVELAAVLEVVSPDSDVTDSLVAVLASVVVPCSDSVVKFTLSFFSNVVGWVVSGSLLAFVSFGFLLTFTPDVALESMPSFCVVLVTGLPFNTPAGFSGLLSVSFNPTFGESVGAPVAVP